MKRLLLFFTCILTFSCAKKAETAEAGAITDTIQKQEPVAKKEFKMYEMSEMAALMEQMYADNQQVRQRIIAGDAAGSFPEYIKKIHTSAMTDQSENDAFFKEQAAKFINAQEKIYSDPANAKQHFNDAVSSCVACHQGKCEGPIPRIKKLYIK